MREALIQNVWRELISIPGAAVMIEGQIQDELSAYNLPEIYSSKANKVISCDDPSKGIFSLQFDTINEALDVRTVYLEFDKYFILKVDADNPAFSVQGNVVNIQFGINRTIEAKIKYVLLKEHKNGYERMVATEIDMINKNMDQGAGGQILPVLERMVDEDPEGYIKDFEFVVGFYSNNQDNFNKAVTGQHVDFYPSSYILSDGGWHRETASDIDNRCRIGINEDQETDLLPQEILMDQK